MVAGCCLVIGMTKAELLEKLAADNAATLLDMAERASRRDILGDDLPVKRRSLGLVHKTKEDARVEPPQNAPTVDAQTERQFIFDVVACALSEVRHDLKMAIEELKAMQIEFEGRMDELVARKNERGRAA
jgi:hypothetical protein